MLSRQRVGWACFSGLHVKRSPEYACSQLPDEEEYDEAQDGRDDDAVTDLRMRRDGEL